MGFSAPTFWIGLILQLTVGLRGFIPIQGRYSAQMRPPGITGFLILDAIITRNVPLLVDAIIHLILPSLTLSMFMIALITRVSRSGMIETLNEDYIVAALGKGLTYKKVIFKHALRNAIIPVVTVSGMLYALLLGGAVLTETVFSLPGMGRLLIESIYSRDYPVLQGTVVVFALEVVIVSVVIDILCAASDPRICE